MSTTNLNSQPKIPSNKLLGEILQEAGLISPAQIDLALQDQSNYFNLKIGEILALRGWLKQETVDFFADKWLRLLKEEEFAHHPLGYYFQSAGLLNEQQIEAILKEQKKLGRKFGSIAVLKGFLKQQTLDYFLTQIQQRQTNTNNTSNQLKSISNSSQTQRLNPTQRLNQTQKLAKPSPLVTRLKIRPQQEQNVHLKPKNNDGKDTIITPIDTIVLPSCDKVTIKLHEIYYSPISIDF